MRTLFAILAVAAVAACTQETTTTDTPDTTVEAPAPPAPTVIMITESDARSRVEAAGYTNVTGLTQNADGTWTATGTREGTTTQLSIGDGGVTVVTTTP